MKQRHRIRRMKDHLYPWWIYAARRRKAWAQVRAAGVKISDALREAYERARA
jgi:exoribonuclease II